MLVLERILAIPDESVDYLQMGISGGERAALEKRGFVRKDGIKAKDYMIRTIQKTEKNKAKAGKAIIKGDKKLVNKPIEMADLKTAEVKGSVQQVPVGKYLVAGKADLDHFNKHPKKVEWNISDGNNIILAKAVYGSKRYTVDMGGERQQVDHRDLLEQLEQIKTVGGKITPFKAEDLLKYGTSKNH
jgi:hypothetical protein